MKFNYRTSFHISTALNVIFLKSLNNMHRYPGIDLRRSINRILKRQLKGRTKLVFCKAMTMHKISYGYKISIKNNTDVIKIEAEKIILSISVLY